MNSDDFQLFLVCLTAIVALCVGLPMVLHYRTKGMALRAAQGGAGADMQGLWDTARRMETRIGYLEAVLDTEVPGWRSRSAMQ